MKKALITMTAILVLLTGCSKGALIPTSKTSAISTNESVTEVQEVQGSNQNEKEAIDLAKKFLTTVFTFKDRKATDEVAGSEFLVDGNFKKSLIDEVSYQLGYEKLVKKAGGIDQLPEVQKVNVVEIISLPNYNPKNYSISYIVNSKVFYNPKHFQLQEYSLPGLVVSKGLSDGMWQVTWFNFAQHLEYYHLSNGRDYARIVPKNDDEKNALEVAKTLIKEGFTFSNLKDASDLKGMDKLWIPSGRKGYSDSAIANNKEILGTLSSDKLPRVSNLIGTELIPFLEIPYDNVDKAYAINFDIEFDESRESVNVKNPGVIVVHSDGQWFAIKMGERMTPWNSKIN